MKIRSVRAIYSWSMPASVPGSATWTSSLCPCEGVEGAGGVGRQEFKEWKEASQEARQREGWGLRRGWMAGEDLLKIQKTADGGQ